jgi:hypothetical protein
MFHLNPKKKTALDISPKSQRNDGVFFILCPNPPKSRKNDGFLPGAKRREFSGMIHNH